MPSLNFAECFAEFLQSAAATFAVVRLVRLGLARKQPATCAFVIFNAVAPLLLVSLSFSSPLYFWMFIGYTALNWAASFAAVREMFALSMASYPGIRTAARWALYVLVAFSVLLSVGITGWNWGTGRDPSSNLFFVQVADRSILLTLAAIVAGLLLFLSRYPLHLPRNTYTSCIFFSGVLLCQAAVDLIDSFREYLFSYQADIAGAMIYAALYAGWAWRLKPETVPEVAAESRQISFEKPDEAELLRQLEAMNRLLIRVGRR